MKVWKSKIRAILESWNNWLRQRFGANQPTGNKYVAFCDILGFSAAIIADFDKTANLYNDFRKEVAKRNELFDIQVSIYSDAVVIVGDDLVNVAQTVQLLQWSMLRYNWLVRGGIAYGRHWKESDKNNLFVVSEPLVKAVALEGEIKHPIVAIDKSAEPGMSYWLLGFKHGLFDLPIIHYRGVNIINPFNNYWFKSAEVTIANLKSQFPLHHTKHDYLLELIADIKSDYTFVPQHIIDEIQELERGNEISP